LKNFLKNHLVLLYLLIFEACFYKNFLHADSKIYGVTNAKVVDPGVMINQIPSNSTNSSESKTPDHSQGLFFLTSPTTEVSQDIFGSIHGAASVDLVGMDGKRPEYLDGKLSLMLDMKSSDGESIKARLVFEDEKLVFNKTGQAQIKTKIRIENPIKPGKKKGRFRASYYIQIQN